MILAFIILLVIYKNMTKSSLDFYFIIYFGDRFTNKTKLEYKLIQLKCRFCVFYDVNE